jgi:hypothetical protein
MRLLPILFLMFSCLAYGQDFDNPNKLPPCPKDQYHNCWGTYTWANGEKYVGEFKDGGLGGHGTYTWVNGENYVGEFKRGKRHGEGILTSPDGKREEGIFENDNFIREVRIKKHGEKTKSDVALAPVTNDCSEEKIKYGFTLRSAIEEAFSVRKKDSERNNICTCVLFIERGRQFESPQNNPKYYPFRLQYPKSQSFLDSYFQKHNACLPKGENEHWAQIWKLLNEDEADYRSAEAIKLKAEKAKADIVLAPVRARLKELCQKIPKINVLALENLSNRLGVNPNSIQLARVIYDDSWISCEGVVYFPGGTKTLYIEFDNAGLITNFSNAHHNPYKFLPN